VCRALTAVLLGAGLFAQHYPPGPQVVTFWSNVDDSDQPYALYVPENFDPAKRYPLVISLHGAYSNHRLNLRRVFGEGNRMPETDAMASSYLPPLREVDFIVASPYARGTMGYQGIAEKDVYDVMADVKRRFPIDGDRVYLTGLSMGGGGTLWLGLTRPDVWAAIAAVCAAAPPGTEELARNALNLPVRLFHGDQDETVPVEVSRQWHRRFLKFDVKAEYVEYPGVHHNAWDLAYKNGAIFEWFAKFRRVRYPERVRFVSNAYQYDSAYWVRIDGLTPGTPASIDARFTGVNRIEVAIANLDGFTLKLAGHPKYSQSGPVTVAIDGAAVQVKPRETLSFAKSDRTWRAAHLITAPGDKYAGAEGPVAEILASRHIYVYGTGGSPGADELRARRAIAEQAASWSGMAGRVAMAFEVKEDRKVEESDFDNANLVLFGTKSTNSVIARLSPKFPVELNAGAADYGLVFIVPVAGHYVLVNSGLTWWTGADQIKWPGYQFLSPPVGILRNFGDCLLFKGSLENIVVDGRFDRHWKLAPDTVTKMQATGAVVIK